MGQLFSSHDKVVASNFSSKSAKKSPFVCEKHCEILTRSWPLIDSYGPEKIGIAMFTGLFNTHPESFQMFRAFRDEPQWQTSPHFHHHCRVVVAVIGSSIKTLKTPEILCPHLQFLGTQHSVRGITLEHMACLGSEFMKALEGVLSPMGSAKWNDAIKKAWKDLYDTIAALISKHMGLDEAQAHADLLDTLVSQQSSHLQQQQASNANAGGQGLPKRISQGQGLASGLATGSAPGSAPGSGPGSAPGSARVPLHMKLDPRVLENLVRQQSSHMQQQASIAQSVSMLKMDGF